MGMKVWVDVEEQGAPWSPILGALVVRYNGVQGLRQKAKRN